MSVQIGLSVKSPHPEIATAHPNGKIQVFTFAVPPPEAQRARAGTEVAEKFFEKVRSSLDGQGKCVKIFLGNGGEYRVFTSAVAPKQPERIYRRQSRPTCKVAFSKKFSADVEE